MLLLPLVSLFLEFDSSSTQISSDTLGLYLHSSVNKTAILQFKLNDTEELEWRLGKNSGNNSKVMYW